MFPTRAQGDGLGGLESAAYQLGECGVKSTPLWAFKDAFCFGRPRTIFEGKRGGGEGSGGTI